MELINVLGGLYSDYRNYTRVNHKLPIKTRPIEDKVDKIFLHATDASGWSPEKLSNFFIDERQFPICSYHFYVTKEKVYHMVGEHVITNHAQGFNSSSIGVALDYYPTRDEKLNVKPDHIMLDLSVNLIAGLCVIHKIAPTKVFGHRERLSINWFDDKKAGRLPRKICPGMAIDMDKYRYDVTRRVQTLLTQHGSIVTIDGIFGPKTKTAMENFT